MANEKVYAPISAKQIETQYGPIIKLSGKADFLAQWIKQHANEQGFINLDIGPRREVGKYGQTHNVTLNQWKPESKAQQPEPEPEQQAAPEASDANEDNIPY